MAGTGQWTRRPAGVPRVEVSRADLALVFLGGAAGTAARAAAEQTFPTPAGTFPWTTLVVNVVGALLLGTLLQAVPPAGAGGRRAAAARLGLGTGALGGFTTYSAFAVEVLGLGTSAALAYSLATVLLGLGAAAVGAVVGRRTLSRPQRGGAR